MVVRNFETWSDSDDTRDGDQYNSDSHLNFWTRAETFFLYIKNYMNVLYERNYMNVKLYEVYERCFSWKKYLKWHNVTKKNMYI